MWASFPFSFLSPVRSAQAAARPSIGPSSAARNFAELRASRGTSEFLQYIRGRNMHTIRQDILCGNRCVAFRNCMHTPTRVCIAFLAVGRACIVWEKPINNSNLSSVLI